MCDVVCTAPGPHRCRSRATAWGVWSRALASGDSAARAFRGPSARRITAACLRGPGLGAAWHKCGPGNAWLLELNRDQSNASPGQSRRSGHGMTGRHRQAARWPVPRMWRLLGWGTTRWWGSKAGGAGRLKDRWIRDRDVNNPLAVAYILFMMSTPANREAVARQESIEKSTRGAIMKLSVLAAVLLSLLVSGCAGVRVGPEQRINLGARSITVKGTDGFRLSAVTVPDGNAPNVFVINGRTVIDQEPVRPKEAPPGYFAVLWSLDYMGVYSFPSDNAITFGAGGPVPTCKRLPSAYKVIACVFAKPTTLPASWKYSITINNDATGVPQTLDPSMSID